MTTSATTTAIPKVELAKQMNVTQHRTLWRDALRRFSRNRLAIIGLFFVLFLIFLAIFADVISPFPYDKANFAKVRLFPFVDPAHPLGTDEVGRDFLSRLIYGARTSMIVGLALQLIALAIGVPIGGLAGYLGGRFDFVVTRIIEILTAFPGLLFAILIISALNGGLWSTTIGSLGKVIIALSIGGWTGYARLVRAQVLSLREKEYVESARSIGATQTDIIRKHLIPNLLSPLLISISFGIPGAMFAEAGLSFLGLGINDPLASWGKMVGASGAWVKVYWHLALFPTLAIALSMLSFSFVGDGLRDALDPKLIE